MGDTSDAVGLPAQGVRMALLTTPPLLPSHCLRELHSTTFWLALGEGPVAPAAPHPQQQQQTISSGLQTGEPQLLVHIGRPCVAMHSLV